ncbi:MAG: site-2 protease family protein [Candidatus Hydrothermales bacterium]
MDEINKIIEEVFVIHSFYKKKNIPVYIGYFTSDNISENLKFLRSKLREINYVPAVYKLKGFYYAIEIYPEYRIKFKDFIIALLLLLMTVLTTMFAGSMHYIGDFEKFLENFPESLLYGFPFSFSLLSILLSHEMGHFLMSRKFGVHSTLPYFIPVPHPLVGTFGAFIKVKSPIPDRKALLRIGAAGPLFGVAISIPFLIWGISKSKIVFLEDERGIFLGDPLLFKFLFYLIRGDLPQDADVLLHPVAFAGWIGLFVTAMNLLPFSQLDGGHIMYALLGEKFQIIQYILFPFLILIGFIWPGWFFWGFLILLFGLRHPPPVDNITPLDKNDKILGLICVVIFILTFHPVPFTVKY